MLGKNVGEMAKWIRVYIALAEDQNLVSTITLDGSQLFVTPVRRDPTVSIIFYGCLKSHMHRYTHIHIIKAKMILFFKSKKKLNRCQYKLILH